MAQPYTPRAETKRKKEFDLKAREKETSNAIMGKEKRQKNIAPMKKQTRSTKDQRGKKKEGGGVGGEIGKIPEKEFKVMILKMYQGLKNRMEKMQE